MGLPRIEKVWCSTGHRRIFRTNAGFMHCLTHGEGLIDCCFLFSCLIDADRINSSDFEREEPKEIRRLTENLIGKRRLINWKPN